jgi:hypothetical protein
MKFTGFALSAALAVSAASSASTLTMTYLGRGHTVNTGVAYNSSLAWNARFAATYQTIPVGSQRFGAYGQERMTFCTQVYEGVTAGSQYTFNIVGVSQVPEADTPANAPGPMGAIKATLVEDLYRRYYAGLGTAAQIGAFQLAVYEITHENIDATSAAQAVTQLGLDKGAFQANKTGGIFASASAMLASLGQGGFRNMGGQLAGLSNSSAQDQLLVVPVGAPVVLAGLGLVGVGFMRRRMK